MRSKAIIESEGMTFTHWDVSLAVSQRLDVDGTEPIAFSLHCVPVRIDEQGQKQSLDSAEIVIVRGRETEITDSQEQIAFSAMRSAFVDFLRVKGL